MRSARMLVAVAVAIRRYADMTRMVNLVAIALFPIAMSLATRADAEIPSTTTAEIGGTGGVHFDVSCKKPEDFLIGFDYSSGKALNFIIPVCHAQKNGKWTQAKEYRLLPPIGGPAAIDTSSPVAIFPTFGVTPQVPRCTTDHFVTALHVWWDHFGDVHHIEVFCHDLSRKSETTFYTVNQGGQPNQDHSAPCPTNFFAMGLIGAGSSSTLVNRLGLRCHSIGGS